MRSEKQNEASRINGAQSKGPVSEEGKQKSRLNSFIHGVYCASNSILFRGEDPLALDAVRQDFTTCFNPQGPAEKAIIESMTHAHWRCERMKALQTHEVALEVAVIEDDARKSFIGDITDADFICLATRSSLNKSGALTLFHTMEFRYRREFSRCFRDLEKLRTSEALAQATQTETAGTNPSPPPEPAEPIVQNKPKPIAKVGRNALCPCGSNKKFKRCCLNRPVKTEGTNPRIEPDSALKEAA